MIRIPLFLAVAQWALLGALGVLVVIVFRQLGKLLTGAPRDEQLGPAVGSRAAALTYVRPGEQAIRRLMPGGGQPLLLAFVDPTCPSCEELVGVLGELRAAGDLDGLRALLLISDPPSYLQISDVFGSTSIEIGRPARRDGLDSYLVSATPLLVAIDGDGIVRAAGSVVRAAEVRAFCQAGVPPATEAVRPATEAVRPATEAVRPATEAVRPATEAVRPATEAVRPATEAVRPATEAVRPATEAVRPATEAVLTVEPTVAGRGEDSI